MLFIIAAHIIDILFLSPYVEIQPLAYVASLAVAKVEFFSIDEGVNKMTGVSIASKIKHLFKVSEKPKK